MRKLLLALSLSFMLSGCIVRFGGYHANADMISETKHGIFFISTDSGKDIWTDEVNTGGGLGTGILIGENLILTNAHVVNEATGLKVNMEYSPRQYDAKTLYIDKVMDLALLEMVDYATFQEENEKYKILELADSYQQGDAVFAIGHPIAKEYTVTRGVISYIGRKIEPSPRSMIQTDAQILQGNSGGPLVDIEGKVVGINDIIVPVMGGTLSFAIPATYVAKALHDWKEYGEVRWTTIGVTLERNLITGVLPESPADLAGLQTGDRILGITIDGEEHEIYRSLDITNLMSLSDSESIFSFRIKDTEGDEINLDVDPTFKKSADFEENMKAYRKSMSGEDPPTDPDSR